ncbi:RdlA protein [Streptosporangium nondiastaticum]|uniref:RdlA protein n=1 Tax=Streptosporangium nondiastaticum TaxID=35764 RepID=A0A9X7JNA2_9ACTN|nr:rodlin [Streptosporangium nondiastaticum]PSJ26792.1 RdlA protein [Streptosporangium nondiastaticum]
MLKKVLTTAAVTVTSVGTMAGPAMAIGNDQDVANGNASHTGYGNTITGGKESPQMSLIQGTLNKPCLGIGKIGIQSVLALVANIGIQDVPILTSQQQQQCTDNSTISDGDDPLSHILDEIPIISGNGSGNKGGGHPGFGGPGFNHGH